LRGSLSHEIVCMTGAQAQHLRVLPGELLELRNQSIARQKEMEEEDGIKGVRR